MTPGSLYNPAWLEHVIMESTDTRHILGGGINNISEHPLNTRTEPKRSEQKRERYTVFFSSDRKGVLPLSVAVWSVLEHAARGTVYDVRILSDGITEEEREGIQAMANRCGESHSVRFFDIDKVLPPELQTMERWPRAAWGRIFAPQMFPDVHRALYLDIDVMCCVDLSPLFRMNLKGAAIAALREHKSHPGSHFNDRLNIPQECAGYFNSGVLLIDLDMFRAENMTKRILDFAARFRLNSTCPDQDAINGALCRYIIPLHPRWNWNDGKERRMPFIRKNLPYWKGYPLIDSVQAALYPGIMHFMGEHKPWRYNHRIDGYLYEACMRRAGVLRPGERLPGFSWGLFLGKILRIPLCVHARHHIRWLAKKLGVSKPVDC